MVVKRVIKVVIAESHKQLKEGIEAELSGWEDIQLCGFFDKPDLFKAFIKNNRPDVAVIDLKFFSSLDVGLDILRDVKQVYPDIRCLVYTGFPEEPQFTLSLQAGAEGFARKESEESEELPGLADLIRIIGNGGYYYDKKLFTDYRIRAVPPRIPQITENLTDREVEVLQELALGKSKREIARSLHITEGTVKTHVQNIYHTLGVRNRYLAIIRGYENGLINLPEDEYSL